MYICMYVLHVQHVCVLLSTLVFVFSLGRDAFPLDVSLGCFFCLGRCCFPVPTPCVSSFFVSPSPAEKNGCAAVRAGSPERSRGVDEAGKADGGVPAGPHAEQNRHCSGEVRLRRRGVYIERTSLLQETPYGLGTVQEHQRSEALVLRIFLDLFGTG